MGIGVILNKYLYRLISHIKNIQLYKLQIIIIYNNYLFELFKITEINKCTA